MRPWAPFPLIPVSATAAVLIFRVTALLAVSVKGTVGALCPLSAVCC